MSALASVNLHCRKKKKVEAKLKKEIKTLQQGCVRHLSI